MQLQLPSCPLSVAGAPVRSVTSVRNLGVLSTTISARLLMFGESCPAASPPFANFVTSMDMSLMTIFALWSCRRLFLLDSTMATSSWLGFLPISRDNYSQSSMLRLVWCIDFVIWSTSQTHFQLCTGCACQSVWIWMLLSWHSECCIVLPHHTRTSWFMSPTFLAVTDFAHRHHTNCTSRPSDCQLSVAGRRSFPVAAAITWNSLPSDVQSSPS